jgi:hypothetical protein
MNSIILEVHTCNIDYDYNTTNISCYIDPIINSTDNLYYICGSRYDKRHLSRFRPTRTSKFGRRLNNCGLFQKHDKGKCVDFADLHDYLRRTERRIVIRVASDPECVSNTLNYFVDEGIRTTVFHIQVSPDEINNYDYIVNELIADNQKYTGSKESIEKYIRESANHEDIIKNVVDRFSLKHDTRTFDSKELLSNEKHFKDMLEFLQVNCDQHELNRSVANTRERCDLELNSMGYSLLRLEYCKLLNYEYND